MMSISSMSGNLGAAALGGLRSAPGPAIEKLTGKEALGFSEGVGKTSGSPESFGSMVDHFVSGVDDRMRAADVEKSKVLTGETTSLHQAMISMQEASVAFTLMTEVRNKLVESYQEMMRMQV